MNLQGNLSLLSGGSLLNARIENYGGTPNGTLSDGRIWYDTTDKAFKGVVNGGDVIQFAVGGALANYVLKAGDAMSGTLTLSNGATVTGLAAPTANTDAATKKYVDDGLALKEPNVIGAATTIVQANLDPSLTLVSDINGKVAVSATTTTELGYVHGVTSSIQTQIDSKEPNINGAATSIVQANLTADRALLSDVSGKVAASIITTTELGYLTGVTSNVQTQIDNQVLASGDTMTGNLNMGSNKVISAAVPTAANDLVNKAFIDATIAGLNWQEDVKGIQADATLDPGASPATGARYIVADASSLHANFGTITGVGDNDIVWFDGSAWAVAFDVSAQGTLAQGTIAWNAGASKFVMFNGTLWNEFGGLSALNAGIGLTWDAGVLNVNLGAGISALPTDEVGVDLYSASGLFLTEDGSAASAASAAKLSILLDGATMARSATGLKIADSGVTATQIATSVAGDGLLGGAGDALAVGQGLGIVVTADAVAFDEAYGDGRYINTAGDTMTGNLTLAGAPTSNLHAATKQYVDGSVTDLSTTLSTSLAALTARFEQSYFVYTSSTAATSHVVAHNMNNKYANITVVDSNDQVVLPQSITFDTADQLTVVFNAAIDCKVVVSGLKVPAV